MIIEPKAWPENAQRTRNSKTPRGSKSFDPSDAPCNNNSHVTAAATLFWCKKIKEKKPRGAPPPFAEGSTLALTPS
ncbi:hypothetical protein TNCV_2617691 [Trichonephila clavipes]|nr:hypothetical protein TNCV_2617691 [Trichonephila clavipes]